MKYRRVISLALCLVVAYSLVALGRAWYRTGVYDSSRRMFLISDIAIHCPESIRHSILEINDMVIRKNVPFARRGSAIPQSVLDHHIPAIREFHQSLVPAVSKMTGHRVATCPSVSGTARTVLVYDRVGDYIEWHYDTNAQSHPSSRFYTLLLPVETRSECMTFRVKVSHDTATDLRLPVLFEGPTTFHSATPMCGGERRVVLALTFCTHPDSVDTGTLMHRLKQQMFS